MKNVFSISVKNPCMENFENFDKTEMGGYCSSCQKEVIDFAKMTDSELTEFFSNTSSELCGRFKTSQLKTYETLNPFSMTTDLVPKSFAVMGFSLLALCAISNVRAQETSSLNTEIRTEIASAQDTKSAPSAMQQNYTVKGIVLDEENLPIPGVSVVLKGTGEGVATDFNGKFEFPRALNVSDILVFSYIGYDSKEYKVPESESSVLDVTVNFESIDIELMGEVVIGGVHKTKRNIFQRFADLFR